MPDFTRWAFAAAMTLFSLSAAADENVVRIGVLTDMSGQLKEYSGPGSVVAAQLAVEDFGGKVNGKPIEIVSADHQLKSDVALGILRQWFDTKGVDAVIDLTLSNIALAGQNLVREKNKVVMFTGPATTELYRESCSPNGVDWSMDNYGFGTDLPQYLLKHGGKKWFLLVSDYAFGHNLKKLVTAALESGGGEVVGSVMHPFGTSDYSSFLLQAQSTGADVLAFLNSNDDSAIAIKQAREFGLDRSMQFVAPADAIHTIFALGLQEAQGLTLVTPTYWDLNEATRAFTKRFEAKMHKVPTDGNFLAYSAVTHYLKAVQRTKHPTDGAAVVSTMKTIPVSDPIFKGSVRIDGRVIYDVRVVTVKKPSESTGSSDVYKVIDSIPADTAFAPLAGSPCSLVKQN
jgi:branched-chain amino acid transport system substrate-binding protein